MDRMTLLGVLIALLTTLLGIFFTEADFLNYLSLPSILIVLGGSLGAMVAMHFGSNIANFFRIFKLAFTKYPQDSRVMIVTLISFSEKSRREGLLSLEEDASKVEDDFMRTALNMMIDGLEPEVVKQVLTNEITALENRHAEGRRMFEDLAMLSPTFGMIGTLIGLILMLSSLGGDLSLIGQGMSAALLTTLYGVFLANAVWLPIANKLERRTNQEVFAKEVIVESTLSLQFGDNPRILRQKILSYFSKPVKEQIEKGDY